jgi:hypothetical protein
MWLVATRDVEGVSLLEASLHDTREGALKAWDVMRLKLLADFTGRARHYPDLYAPMIEAMKETDIEKLDNGCHEEPFIKAIPVLEVKGHK